MKGPDGLPECALATIGRYSMLSGGERVAVAVSGGADSTAMLLLLAGISGRMGLELLVFHLDHMLRGADSAADARFVEELCSELGIPCTSRAVDVAAETARGQSPEDAARKVRLRELERFAGESGCDRVALGHTADDQVETFLMRMVQGAGLAGMAAIRPVSGEVIRPLIETWRSQVDSFCAGMGVEPRIDSSNMDRRFLRNTVRLDLLPYLVGLFGEQVKEVMLREVETLSVDRDYLLKESKDAFARVGRVTEGEVRLDIDSLLGLEAALQRGVLREAWSRLLPGRPPPSWRHVNDVLDKVAAGSSGASLDLPHSLAARREYGELVLGARESIVPFETLLLSVPGEVELAPGGPTVISSVVPSSEARFSDDPGEEFVRPDLATPLEVRSPVPGERFWPLGAPGEKKIADFLIDAKVPRARRGRLAVVLSGGRVVWVCGVRLDDRFKLRPQDRRAVRLLARDAGEYDLRGGIGPPGLYPRER